MIAVSDVARAEIKAGEARIQAKLEIMQRMNDLAEKKQALADIWDACIRQGMFLNDVMEAARSEALRRVA